MCNNVFAKPKFTGGRFTEHTLPVSVAGDLAAYEALLIDVAKHLYLTDHPERQRVPKGFTDVHLDIAHIEDGSTISVLKLVMAVAITSQLSLFGEAIDQRGYFVRARDLIAECIDSPADSLPANFPKGALTHFNHLGRSLRADETLELGRVNNAQPAILTSEKRRELVLAASAVYEREVELSGYIEEIDAHKSSLRLRLDADTTAIVSMPNDFLEQARLSLGNTRDRVFVQGIAQYNSHEILQKIISYDSIEIIKNYELVICFDMLSQIDDGWFEGGGKTPNNTDLQDIAQIMIQFYPEKLPLPSIVPTQDGNLLFEWQTENMPSVDIDLASKTASFHAFGEHDLDIERDFYLTNSENIDEFFAFLSQHIQELQA